jgi:hypothetical protein
MMSENPQDGSRPIAVLVRRIREPRNESSIPLSEGGVCVIEP